MRAQFLRLRLALVLLAISAAASPKCEAADPASEHWSLRPRSRPAVPEFDEPASRSWCRNPIDSFILARLKAEGLRPAREADRPTLIRRLTFDLTGLPPTPEEIAAFASDSSANAYENVVDRLLDSPRYGERWGRHWLDVVRFAETEGFEYDRYRPGAWRFRDYVIDAFNRDKPFDRFVTEQLAGDELEPENHELLVASGFHRLGAVRRNAGNQEIAFSRNEVLTEMTDIVGTAFLGLTVGCARCHDHMFDDIPQVDYYRLQAFMAATHEHDLVLAPADEQAAWKTENDKVQRQLKRLKDSLPRLSGEAEAEAEKKISELEKILPAPLPAISAVKHLEEQRTPIHVLYRGNAEKKEKQVGPRVLSALASATEPELSPEVASPRTFLARWLVAPDNPLTARVMVNRIWQRHFGRGIVQTANDFGLNGASPSHPELLDWLADDFVDGGWRVKRLHRLIVLSSTYRQASGEETGGEESDKPKAESGPAVAARTLGRAARVVDPENRLLWQAPRRRLNAEEIRDSMLAVSGRLIGTMGGPSIIIPVESDLVNLLYAPSQWIVTAAVEEHDRRSVYLIAKRNLRLPFMETFDQPDAQTSCANRESSTHALQSMELLNGRLSNNLAESFARRLVHEAGSDPARQVERAYLLAAGRAPTREEARLAIAFLARQPLKEFALALFNLNAFLYVN
jgi:hypothetical protein